jgi:hypothetical protein
VPRKIAHSWLQNHYLIPLLDGLDEVETTLQPGCVAAVNAFVEEFDPSGLVVCCRLNEYRWLPERLKLNGAICLEPLSKDEVAEYFTRDTSRGGIYRASFTGVLDHSLYNEVLISLGKQQMDKGPQQSIHNKDKISEGMRHCMLVSK